MDVAGAIGTTAIFPMVIGLLTLGVTLFYAVEIADERPDMHQRRVMGWLLAVGTFFVLFAMVAWIVAIWLGFAQGASG